MPLAILALTLHCVRLHSSNLRIPSRTKVSYEEWTTRHVAEAERKIPSQGGGKIYRLSTSKGHCPRKGARSGALRLETMC